MFFTLWRSLKDADNGGKHIYYTKEDSQGL